MNSSSTFTTVNNHTFFNSIQCRVLYFQRTKRIRFAQTHVTTIILYRKWVELSFFTFQLNPITIETDTSISISKSMIFDED